MMERCIFCGGVHLSTCPMVVDNVVDPEALSRIEFEKYARTKHDFGYWSFFTDSQGVIFYEDPEVHDVWKAWKLWYNAALKHAEAYIEYM
jgi:hypothetical protein